MTFLEKYAALENKLKDKIKEENEFFGWEGKRQSYYLPNVEPEGPAAFVLVAMEPSSNARTSDGKQKTPRNFALSVDDFIFTIASEITCVATDKRITSPTSRKARH